jgi:hypothetical protein
MIDENYHRATQAYAHLPPKEYDLPVSFTPKGI